MWKVSLIGKHLKGSQLLITTFFKAFGEPKIRWLFLLSSSAHWSGSWQRIFLPFRKLSKVNTYTGFYGGGCWQWLWSLWDQWVTQGTTFLSSRVRGVSVRVSRLLLLSHVLGVGWKKHSGCPRNLETPSAQSGAARRVNLWHHALVGTGMSSTQTNYHKETMIFTWWFENTKNALSALLIILLVQMLLGPQENLVFLIFDSLLCSSAALSRVMLSAVVDGLGVPFFACFLPYLQTYPVV